jgi:hypothetical protein
MLLFAPSLCFAQLKWDGGGLDGRWENPANWQPDGIPPTGGTVLLDNSLFAGNYSVTLPAGDVTVELVSLQIAPSGDASITLELPRQNTAAPGLRITGAGESLALERGAVLRNASGAASGETLQVLGNFRIANEGHYIHQTPRGNASLIDRLSLSAGTETGIFEFDVPGTAGYTVSLTGNTFGTLAFGASAAGGAKSYSGSGASALRIRGNWLIRQGATLTTTMSANILLEGSLLVDGTLQLQPSTAGTTGRSLLCLSPDGQIGGSGNLSLQANFRDISIGPGAAYRLGRSLALPFAQNQFQVLSGGALDVVTHVISGSGSFTLDAGGSLSLGHPSGISSSGPVGQVTTSSRTFNAAATYRYTGETDQETGSGLPAIVAGLIIDKPGGHLRLSNNVTITDTLRLQHGIIRSTSSAMPSISATVLVSPANAFGATDQGWEGSYVEGPMRYESSGEGRQSLPVGKAGRFAPISIIRENDGLASYTVEYHPQPFVSLLPVNPARLRKVSALEYWSVSASGEASAIPARIALSWRPSSDVGASDAAKAELRVGQFEDRGGGWEWDALGVLPQWQESNGYGWVESDQEAASFRVFTLGSSGALNLLPLRRLSLRAEYRENGVLLRCMPEGDGECPPLQLERSADGLLFYPLGMPSHGVTCGREVLWADSIPLSPSSYYRVRQAVTGSAIMSPVVRVNVRMAVGPQLYPNPTGHELIVHFPGLRSGTPATIVQMGGRQVRHFFLSGEIHRENVHALPPGRYYLMVRHPNGRVVLPFLKR